ncbi:MAG: ATP-binding protein [Chloroflexi bacterium]|uniref:ATP-binding protein n=1 Tax=Candidatus Flexifilum breve TaxID=3140694 RepID=UPI003135AB72|nr:ATP-binding protein [Chloroflexota bacterium]
MNDEQPLLTLDIQAVNAFMAVIGVCVEETLQRVGITVQQDRYNVQLALHEIAVNIVNHAYAGRSDGRIRLSVYYAAESRCMTFELLDTGTGFDPNAVAEPDLDTLPEHGLGLMLAYSLMDRVEYTCAGTFNRWRMIKTFK